MILLKLRWAHMSGGSERQLADCKGIMKVCKDQIDVGELEHWALRFGIKDLWLEVRRLAEI
jgi:hypothetical protein